MNGSEGGEEKDECEFQKWKIDMKVQVPVMMAVVTVRGNSFGFGGVLGCLARLDSTKGGLADGCIHCS